MTMQAHDVTQEQIERLCSGYRAGVEEPAFDTADRLLLRAAARSARYRALQRQLCAPSALLLAALLAVLGSAAAGWFDLSGPHRSVPPAPGPLVARLVSAAPQPKAHRLPARSPYMQTSSAYVQTSVEASTSPVLLTPPSPSVQIGDVPTLPASVFPNEPTVSQPTVSTVSGPTIGTVSRPTVSTYTIGALPAPPKAMPQAAGTISAVQSATGPTRSAAIDLNAPGALELLRTNRPEDYQRIVAILAGITRHPQRDVPRWLRTNFDARDIVYQPLWLTSFPPKRRLSFSLEGQPYRAVLTITDQGARVFPVDDTAQCQMSANRVVCGARKLKRQR